MVCQEGEFCDSIAEGSTFVTRGRVMSSMTIPCHILVMSNHILSYTCHDTPTTTDLP